MRYPTTLFFCKTGIRPGDPHQASRAPTLRSFLPDRPEPHQCFSYPFSSRCPISLPYEAPLITRAIAERHVPLRRHDEWSSPNAMRTERLPVNAITRVRFATGSRSNMAGVKQVDQRSCIGGSRGRIIRVVVCGECVI